MHEIDERLWDKVKDAVCMTSVDGKRELMKEDDDEQAGAEFENLPNPRLASAVRRWAQRGRCGARFCSGMWTGEGIRRREEMETVSWDVITIWDAD